jgi:hypothetical protein
MKNEQSPVTFRVQDFIGDIRETVQRVKTLGHPLKAPVSESDRYRRTSAPLRKGASAASRLWSCLGCFLPRALSSRRARTGVAPKSVYTSSASGWMSSLPLVFFAIR